MYNLADKLKNIVLGDTKTKDSFQIYTGIVMTNEECRAAGITRGDGSTSYYDEKEQVVAVKALTDGSAPSTESSPINQVATVYPYVHLMCAVDDGLILVPAEGSNVKFVVSTWEDPFILQYGELRYYRLSAQSPDRLNSFLQDWGFYPPADGTLQTNTTQLIQYNEAHEEVGSLNKFDSPSYTETIVRELTLDATSAITQSNDGTTLINAHSGSNTATFIVDPQAITLGKENGATIEASELITLKTQNENLKTLLTDLLTGLSTATYINSGGTPTPLVFTPPTLIADLTARLNNLLQ